MQAIFDLLGQIFAYVNGHWSEVVDAISKIVGQVFVLWALLRGALPMLTKLWELLKDYIGLGAYVARDVKMSVTSVKK